MSSADQKRIAYHAAKARAEAARAAGFQEPESKLHHVDEAREFAAWRRQGQLFGAARKPRADFNIVEERRIIRKVSSGFVIRYGYRGHFRGLFSD